MTDDLVKRICQEWIDDGRADDCFWEGWPECPTPEDSLTPRMVLDRIEELEAKLANLQAAQTYRYIGKDGKPVLARHLEDRIKELEAKLAKAVEALGDLVKDCEADYPPSHGAIKYYAQRTLAELTGGKDAKSNL